MTIFYIIFYCIFTFIFEYSYFNEAIKENDYNYAENHKKEVFFILLLFSGILFPYFMGRRFRRLIQKIDKIHERNN